MEEGYEIQGHVVSKHEVGMVIDPLEAPDFTARFCLEVDYAKTHLGVMERQVHILRVANGITRLAQQGGLQMNATRVLHSGRKLFVVTVTAKLLPKN